MILDASKPSQKDGFQSPSVTQTQTLPVQDMGGLPIPKATANLPLPELTERLARRLQNQPGDLAGWKLLIRSYATLGEKDLARDTYEKVKTKTPRDAELRVVYGETLVKEAQGIITPEARKIFLEAHEINKAHPGARHFLALADYQSGEIQKAYDSWKRLVQEAPRNASWLPQVQSHLDQAARKLNR